MGIKTKLLINQEKFSFADETIIASIERNTTSGVDYQFIITDDTSRSLQEWGAWLVSEYSVFQSMNFIDNEFVKIVFTLEGNVLELQKIIFSESFGEKIGFTQPIEITTTVEQIYCFGNTWGTQRLVLQNSLHIVNDVNIYSRLTQPERITSKQKNGTFESIDYVVNEYRKDFDLKRWNLPCRWLSKNKEQWVLDFLDNATFGKVSDTVKMYGDNFWINDTETFFLMTDVYNGCDIDVGHSQLLRFNIGLREVK